MGIIYSEERAGRGGRPFNIYKIKTLKDKENGEVVEFEEEKEMIMSSLHRLLRKYGLDEVPQIVNILLGDMNLFGVRPINESNLKEYSLYYRERYMRHKPGFFLEFSLESRLKKKRNQLELYDYNEYIRKAFLRLRAIKDKESLDNRICFYSFIVWETIKQVISGHDKNI